jgi:hypothetical protein
VKRGDEEMGKQRQDSALITHLQAVTESRNDSSNAVAR